WATSWRASAMRAPGQRREAGDDGRAVATDHDASTRRRPVTGGAFDVITMGRVSVDLYPEQSGVPLAEVRTFAKSLGGSATNVAVAAARYGRRAAVITKVGDDGFGPYVRSALRGFGVDDRYVGTDPVLRTPVVFCELFPPDHFPLLFYRQPTAPDIRIRPDELDLDAIRAARILWTTGTGLSAEPSRSATLAALEARRAEAERRERGGKGAHTETRRTRSTRITIHDLDHRPTLWPDVSESRALQEGTLRYADVAVGHLEARAVAGGRGGAGGGARSVLRLVPWLAIAQLGGDGAAVAWGDPLPRVPAGPAGVVNGLGAGDAFGGALCNGLLAGWSPPE